MKLIMKLITFYQKGWFFLRFKTSFLKSNKKLQFKWRFLCKLLSKNIRNFYMFALESYLHISRKSEPRVIVGCRAFSKTISSWVLTFKGCVSHDIAEVKICPRTFERKKHTNWFLNAFDVSLSYITLFASSKYVQFFRHLPPSRMYNSPWGSALSPMVSVFGHFVWIWWDGKLHKSKEKARWWF